MKLINFNEILGKARLLLVMDFQTVSKVILKQR